MKIAAIIAEYNPFHSGHKYQIDTIRRDLGEDTAVIAIMSGNYTQRGEVAFADKRTRAKAAVLCGANLVLELPFPYSCSSADIFARSGVHIANSLGVVDYLSFGSESGDINHIEEAAMLMSSDEYSTAFASIKSDSTLGYAKISELAYKSISDDDFTFTPNNILAVEYIKALKSAKSDITPHTVKRLGAGYSDSELAGAPHQSASAIRESYDSLKCYIPDEARACFQAATASGDMPCNIDRISAAFLSYFRLSSAAPEDIQDAGYGIYWRLKNSSLEATTFSSLISLSETKKYTNARIRRAALNCFFGVTSSDVKQMPRFTQVLAMDKTGMQILKALRKKSSISVLTKPSNYKNFDEVSKRQKEISERADSIFELTKPEPKSGASALRLTPFIKE